MSKAIIYHNPRCSKSRQTLALLKEKAIVVDIIEYLKNPPSAAQLKAICDDLHIDPIKLMRTKETKFKELGLSKNDHRSVDEWVDLMHENPVLIERPIVVYNSKVAIGRPPENILEIL